MLWADKLTISEQRASSLASSSLLAPGGDMGFTKANCPPRFADRGRRWFRVCGWWGVLDQGALLRVVGDASLTPAPATTLVFPATRSSDLAVRSLTLASLLFQERSQASRPLSNVKEPRARFRPACVWKSASPASESYTVGGSLGRRPRRQATDLRAIGGSANGDRPWSPRAFCGKNRLQ